MSWILPHFTLTPLSRPRLTPHLTPWRRYTHLKRALLLCWKGGFLHSALYSCPILKDFLVPLGADLQYVSWGAKSVWLQIKAEIKIAGDTFPLWKYGNSQAGSHSGRASEHNLRQTPPNSLHTSKTNMMNLMLIRVQIAVCCLWREGVQV